MLIIYTCGGHVKHILFMKVDHTHTQTNTHQFAYIYMYIYIYICMDTNIYIYTYIYTYIRWAGQTRAIHESGPGKQRRFGFVRLSQLFPGYLARAAAAPIDSHARRGERRFINIYLNIF